ncbi:MAG: hypothetical protein K0R06_231, partial [Clostridium sp.]|nr:hypothetical protein [Clostridium sp.]
YAIGVAVGFIIDEFLKESFYE